MEPKKNCNICNRLVDYRNQNTILFPDFYNDRVLGIGSFSSKLLIVGLAPGLRGANRTGKIFNGDFSGNLLFKFLNKYNISESCSQFEEISNLNCRITNAVKCLPPNNRPNSLEIKKDIIEHLWKVLISDNTVDQYESNLMRRICGLIYFSDNECAEIKLNLLNSK